MDIYGLGTFAIDVLMKVDKLPGADSFCIIKSTEKQPGGSGTNVIVQCQRLGADCGFIGCVGDDGIGKEVIDSLVAEGIDTDMMYMKDGTITLHTDIVIDNQGDKFIMLNMGNSFCSLEKDQIKEEAIAGAKVLYTDMIPFEQSLYALQLAKKHGVKTVFNMQVGMDTMAGLGCTKEDILAALKYVDVFAPCQEGLYALTGTEDLDECAKILRPYCDGILIFTLGRNGSVAYDAEDKKHRAECVSVEATDSTGAGDSYIGSFMCAYYLRGYDLDKSMRFASACAAYTCTGIGARFSPTAEIADTMFAG